MSVPSIHSEVLELLLQSVQIDVKFSKYAKIINLSKKSYKLNLFYDNFVFIRITHRDNFESKRIILSLNFNVGIKSKLGNQKRSSLHPKIL